MLPPNPPPSPSGFRWFFTAQTVSLLGSSMAPVALAFAVLGASGRAGDLGVVLAARTLPLLGFMLIGGAVADRLPRRLVLVTANLGSALTQGAVAALLLSGRYALGPVAALSFFNGLLGAFTSPALRGLLPELVPRDRLRRANALLGSVKNGTKVLGPSVSGVLVVAAGGGTAIALDAVSFLLAAVCLTRLPVAPHGGSAAPGRYRLVHELREGWDTFRRTPWVWPVTVAFCGVNLVSTGTWQILGPQLTTRMGSAATWGLVLSVRGAGMLLTSGLLYRLAVRRFLLVGQLSCLLGGLPLLALGTRVAVPWLVGAAFVAGMGTSVMVTAWDTSLQEHIAPGVLSRVAAYDDLLSYVAIPVGQLSMGPLTKAFGPYAVATTAGLLYALLTTLPLLVPAVRRLPHGARAEETTVAA
ncbi:MFS transporter [Streptantibioticus parmotrematis]|uniref:MFS transporter n=1 Tax=Streptantibioticus parmotrematis TaxID=2873249 RepID=UPI003408F43F